MKRCPKCRRDYYDDTLLYCLDDGNALLEGPASVDEPATEILSVPPAVAGDLTPPTAGLYEPATAIFSAQAAVSNAQLQQPATAGGSDLSAKSRGLDIRLLAAPVFLAIIVLGGFFGYRYFAPSKQIESIAVMPFVNESGNPDVDYLSDGMTESLITSLSSDGPPTAILSEPRAFASVHTLSESATQAQIQTKAAETEERPSQPNIPRLNAFKPLLNRTGILVALATLAVVGLVFAGYKFLGQGQSSSLSAPVRVTPLTSSAGVERAPALSPDGSHQRCGYDEQFQMIFIN